MSAEANEADPGRVERLQEEIRYLGYSIGACAVSTAYWSLEYASDLTNKPSLLGAVGSALAMAASAYFQGEKESDLRELSDEPQGNS